VIVMPQQIATRACVRGGKILQRSMSADTLPALVVDAFFRGDTYPLSPPPPPLVDSTQGSNALGFFLG
jgi:hypothetical protein